MCPLQISNDLKALSSTIYALNIHFIYQLPMSKNYLIGHNSKTTKIFKNKKVGLEIYFKCKLKTILAFS